MNHTIPSDNEILAYCRNTVIPLWKAIYFKEHPEENFSSFTKREIREISEFLRDKKNIDIPDEMLEDTQRCWITIVRHFWKTLML